MKPPLQLGAHHGLLVFFCGELGHFQKSCPIAKSNQEKQGGMLGGGLTFPKRVSFTEGKNVNGAEKRA